MAELVFNRVKGYFFAAGVALLAISVVLFLLMLTGIVNLPPEILRSMEAMEADLLVPFRVGPLVFGWVTLRDAPWSDGFSARSPTGSRSS